MLYYNGTAHNLVVVYLKIRRDNVLEIYSLGIM